MTPGLLRRLHLMVGVAGMLTFVATGQYMHWALDHLRDMAEGPRLFFRSTHIYLMWASALNLALGCFVVQPRQGGRRVLQVLASIAVLAGPILMCASFFLETYRPSLERPMSRWANILAFAGVIGIFVASFSSRRQPSEVQELP